MGAELLRKKDPQKRFEKAFLRRGSRAARADLGACGKDCGEQALEYGGGEQGQDGRVERGKEEDEFGGGKA